MDKKILEDREQRIGELIEKISKKTNGFNKPSLIVIGGYALRSYHPLTRYSRDCDFAIHKGKDWVIDRVPSWLSGLSVEAKETIDNWGYLRLVQLIGPGRTKVGLDFMEGEIHGRAGECIIIDEELLNSSTRATINVGGRTINIRVPSYYDFLLLKIVSCRPSDVRDIAALLWKHGAPDNKILIERSRQIVIAPQHLTDKISIIINDINNERFIDSWRGTFITSNFTTKDKQKILKILRQLRTSTQS